MIALRESFKAFAIISVFVLLATTGIQPVAADVGDDEPNQPAATSGPAGFSTAGLHLPTASRVSTEYTMTDGAGTQWEIQCGGAVGNSNNNAYSNGLQAHVRGSNYCQQEDASCSAAGDEIEFGPSEPQNGIKCWRRVKVYKDQPMARWLDIFENTTNSEAKLPIKIQSYFNWGIGVLMVDDKDAQFGPKDWAFATSAPQGAPPSSLLHIVCDKNSKVRPEVRKINNQLQVTYNITVPAKKTAVLCYFESQDGTADPLWKRQKDFRAEKMLKDLPPAVRAMIVNFPREESPAMLELARSTACDTVMLANGDCFFGKAANESFAVTTAFGVQTVPAAQVLGMAADKSKGTMRMALCDGQMLCGALTEQKLRFSLPTGGELQIPFDRIGQWSYQISGTRPEEITPSASLLLFSGDRLAAEPNTLKLSLALAGGSVPLNEQDMYKLKSAGKDGNCVVFFRNGSRLSGRLEPNKIAAVFKLGLKQEITQEDIVEALFGPQAEPDASLSKAALAGGDELIGKIATPEIKLQTDFGDISVKAPNIRSLAPEKDVAKLELWDGSVMRGKIEPRELDFSIVPGPTVKIAVEQIVQITNSRPLPPDEVVQKVAKLVPRLGAESFADRKKAGEELVAMGPLIVPLLQKYMDSTDAEVRRHIRDIITQLGGAPSETPTPDPQQHIRMRFGR